MRLTLSLCLLALTGLPLSAQEAPPRWVISLGVDYDALSGASADTTTVPGLEVEVYPAPRPAVHLGLARHLGRWDVGLELGYAAGGLRARADLLTFDDNAGDVTRYRVGLLLGRQIATLRSARLVLLGGGSLDHWEAGGIGGKSTFSGRAGLALRVPLGRRLEIENRLLGGLGGSPFSPRGLPPEAERRSLRTLSFGAALRWGW